MLIRREDFGNIKKLTKGSGIRVWFTCERCGIGILQQYRNYYKQKMYKLCLSCRRKLTHNQEHVKQKIKDSWHKNKQERISNIRNGTISAMQRIPSHKKDIMRKKISESSKKRWRDPSFINKMSIIRKRMWEDKIYRNKVIESLEISDKEIVDRCNKQGFKYIAKRRVNGQKIITLRCPYNHISDKPLYYITDRIKCLECHPLSKSEDDLVKFLTDNNINVLRNNRTLIKPFELDIVIPEKNVAIEYCGLYWHSELTGKKDKHYHLNKYNMCKNIGYNLITIFEDEWIHKKEIVSSMLLRKLNINNDTKIYARNCDIRVIDYSNAKRFVNENHIQGHGYPASVLLGAYYNNELVSVMTFSIPSISKGQKENSGGIWEINRFCSSRPVVGMAGKFLKYFKNNFLWKIIYSYSDLRWNTGNVYTKIGMTFESQSKPNYWYITDFNKLIRAHRFNYRKSVLSSILENYNDDISEWENMKRNGYDRIWDCGNMKFVIYNN